MKKEHKEEKEFKGLIGGIAKIFTVLMGTILIMFIGLMVYVANPDILAFTSSEKYYGPKDVEAEIAAGFLPQNVKYGYELLTNTPKYLGPQVKDPEMRIAGNNLACISCHLDAGNRLGGASWAGVVERFPTFRPREDVIGSIEDRINGCFERSMNGKRLDEDTREMKAMIAYMLWLSEDMTEEQRKEYRGFPNLEIPEVAVDLEIGRRIYQKHCALCHQDDGQGQRKLDFTEGYINPPLWGPDSYNHGAGMHRVITSAAFIKSNMPSGTATSTEPVLTDEEAFHVAGYINSFDRPMKSNTEADFPNRKLKPVSTSYGPWADDFPAEQHKYGPFLPIVEYYKKEHDLNKTQ